MLGYVLIPLCKYNEQYANKVIVSKYGSEGGTVKGCSDRSVEDMTASGVY